MAQLYAVRQKKDNPGVLTSCLSCGANGRRIVTTYREPARPLRATNVADVHVLAQDMVHHSERPRLLVFCDNRQDAAFQAGWMKDHARRFRLRALMADGMNDSPVSVGDLTRHVDDVLERDETLSRALVPEVWQVVRREGGGGRHEKERLKFLRIQVLREIAMSSPGPAGDDLMKRVLRTVAVLLFVSLPAAAQESGQVGVAMGYPGSIGIIWHASDRMAIRPDFNLTKTTSENTGGFSGSKVDGWALGFGLSALIYTGKKDNLRTYFSPRFAYGRSSTDSDSSSSTSSSETTANSYTFSGSFGAQYSLSRRFSVYGEAGLLYSRNDATFKSSALLSGVTTGTTTSHGFGTRGAVGVVVYF